MEQQTRINNNTMDQSEQLQSEREDSTVTIFRLREELGEEIQALVDKQSEFEKLITEIEATKVFITIKEKELEQLETEHEEKFNESI